MNQINLKIITTKGIILDKLVDIVVVKIITGYIGILRGHIPTISLITSTKIYYIINNVKYKLNLTRGIIYINKEFVKIISDNI